MLSTLDSTFKIKTTYYYYIFNVDDIHFVRHVNLSPYVIKLGNYSGDNGNHVRTLP